jgi:ribosomal protein L13E
MKSAACGLTVGECGIVALHADVAGEIGLHVEPRPIRICFDEPETDPCFSIGAHT